MQSLNFYKKMSDTEKLYINSLVAFRSIYDNCNDYDIELPEDDIVKLKDIILNTYEKDDNYGFSITDIADWITSHYLEDDFDLEELKEYSTQDLLSAIDGATSLFKDSEEMDLG